MTPDLLDLAREVVTLPGWRWMPGMLLTNGQRIDGAEQSRPVRRTERPDPWSPIGATVRVEEYSTPPYLPDLADPATLGCLLALVREAWGQDDLAAVQIGTDGKGGQEWAVRSHLHAPRQHLGWGEAHALVAALRAGGSRD